MRIIARARCTGRVSRCRIDTVRHMGGVMRCWTDTTRHFMLTIPRDTFMLWAKNLRHEKIGVQFPKEFDQFDAQRVMTWLKGKEVKILWEVQTRDDTPEVRYHGYAVGLANTEENSNRVIEGRRKRARAKR